MIFFLCSPKEQDLTFHTNCLHWRHFAWNAKSCFLVKIRKNISKCRLLTFLPRVLRVNFKEKKSNAYRIRMCLKWTIMTSQRRRNCCVRSLSKHLPYGYCHPNRIWVCRLTFAALLANSADDKLKTFYYYYYCPENRLWPVKQIVSKRDNLHERSKSVFWGK